MVPIAAASAKLIIGDRQTGKTAVAIDNHHQSEEHGR